MCIQSHCRLSLISHGRPFGNADTVRLRTQCICAIADRQPFGSYNNVSNLGDFVNIFIKNLPKKCVCDIITN